MNTALRRTTSAAAGNGLDTTIKYLRRTTSGAGGNGRAQRSSIYDAQRADRAGQHGQVQGGLAPSKISGVGTNFGF
jgi:hypothetical protein